MFAGVVSLSPNDLTYPFVIELTEDFTGITKAGASGTLIQDLYVVQGSSV